MLSAISAAKGGNKVVILEKMNMCGKKLLITGKGRCNITSSLKMEDFIKNIPGNGKFLYSAFNNFTNQDIVNILKKHNVDVKEERGNRIFPVSDKSMSVLNALMDELKELNVDICTNSKVTRVIVNENKVAIGVVCKQNENEKEVLADKIILATGGKSYASTGSTGDGYKIAKELGHTVTKIRPSLVPLIAKEKELCCMLQGLSLRNVKIKIINMENKKNIYEDFGEMLFTHFGVSGPTILSGSSHLLRVKNIDQLLKNEKIVLSIDLKSALSEEVLDNRILRDFEQLKNKQFKNSLENLLPKKMIDPIIKLSGINPNKKVNEINREERHKLVNLLKNFEITIIGFRDINEAIVTAGGINIKEINSSTMESKIIKGLYFAGEIIDVDAYTGGFNLQVAYSTGYTAGMGE